MHLLKLIQLCCHFRCRKPAILYHPSVQVGAIHLGVAASIHWTPYAGCTYHPNQHCPKLLWVNTVKITMKLCSWHGVRLEQSTESFPAHHIVHRGRILIPCDDNKWIHCTIWTWYSLGYDPYNSNTAGHKMPHATSVCWHCALDEPMKFLPNHNMDDNVLNKNKMQY